MRLAQLFVLITCTSSFAVPDLRDRMLDRLELLIELGTIEPKTVSAILDQPIPNVQQQSPYRREYHFAANQELASASVVIGGVGDRWRIASLAPAFALRFDDIAPLVLDVPSEVRPRIPTCVFGPPLRPGNVYRFRLATHDLVIEVDTNSVVEEITLTTDRVVRSDAPTLRSRRGS